ncbi:hypothetical protein PC116_g5407 [Phytophthora cactorum]|nr:hypothetical protein PC116_g5407 [Phytophthora cactorum]
MGRHDYPGSWNDGETSRHLQAKLPDPGFTVSGTVLQQISLFQ